MRRVLIALTGAIAIAAAGFFGFELYLQNRIIAKIAVAFEEIRAAGGKAAHGKVKFDLLTHTVTISDITGESAAQLPVSLKISNITAKGVKQADAAHFSADTIELRGLEGSAQLATGADVRLAYKIPQIIVKDYSGPTALSRRPPSSSVLDVYRFAAEQFAEVTASSVLVPGMTSTRSFGGTEAYGGSFTYSGLMIENIKNGKIAAIKADEGVFTFSTVQTGKAGKLTGKLSNVVSHDIDTTALAAILDPSKAEDDRYYSLYGQISIGGYDVSSEQGLNMHIGAMTLDGLSMRPLGPQLISSLSIYPNALTPEQARNTIESIAKLEEGINLGQMEIQGISLDTPQGRFKLSTIRFGLQNGKSQFALEGLEGRSLRGPVKIERFALKSLDIANLTRLSARFATPSPKAAPDQAMRLLQMLEGAEIKGVVAPYGGSSTPANIENISLDWGQFVGPIPTKAHLLAKMTIPVDASNPSLRPLIAAGIDKAKVNIDLGTSWAQASGMFVLDAATLEIGDLLKASSRVSLAHVPRDVFSFDPAQTAMMATQIEAGSLELTIRDLGAVDLAIAQFARMQNIDRDSARQGLIEIIKAASEKMLGSNPDAAAAVDALVHFIESPKETLILKLTPVAKVPALQLFELLKTEPGLALAQFRIEASTGL